MAGEGSGAGKITANTGVTISLVVIILGVSSTAIFKAGQVLTDLDYVKLYIAEIRTDVAEMKRTIGRIDRQQSANSTK